MMCSLLRSYYCRNLSYRQSLIGDRVSMSTAKHDKDDKDNSRKAIDGDTRKVINQTFDDAKNKARKAIDETHRELPRYLP